jgi:hypothetical protein
LVGRAGVESLWSCVCSGAHLVYVADDFGVASVFQSLSVHFQDLIPHFQVVVIGG